MYRIDYFTAKISLNVIIFTVYFYNYTLDVMSHLPLEHSPEGLFVSKWSDCCHSASSTDLIYCEPAPVENSHHGKADLSSSFK